MERVVTVVEAKRDFSELMARVAYSGDRLVVERHGKPMIAWISYDDLQRLEQLEQQGAAQRENGWRPWRWQSNPARGLPTNEPTRRCRTQPTL